MNAADRLAAASSALDQAHASAQVRPDGVTVGRSEWRLLLVAHGLPVDGALALDIRVPRGHFEGRPLRDLLDKHGAWDWVAWARERGPQFWGSPDFWAALDAAASASEFGLGQPR